MIETRTLNITLPEKFCVEIESYLPHVKSVEAAIYLLARRGLGVNEWSNAAAIGYAVSAASAIGLENDVIANLISAMYREFDVKTVREAEQAYLNFRD